MICKHSNKILESLLRESLFLKIFIYFYIFIYFIFYFFNIYLQCVFHICIHFPSFFLLPKGKYTFPIFSVVCCYTFRITLLHDIHTICSLQCWWCWLCITSPAAINAFDEEDDNNDVAKKFEIKTKKEKKSSLNQCILYLFLFFVSCCCCWLQWYKGVHWTPIKWHPLGCICQPKLFYMRWGYSTSICDVLQ